MHRIPRHLALLVAAAFAAAAQATDAPKRRTDVEAEYAQAVRDGDVRGGGDSGLTLRELYPQRYQAPAQVQADRRAVVEELRAARRSGELVAAGEGAFSAHELNPGAYPKPAATGGRTRDEVRADWREALRTGDVAAIGDTGLLRRELHPRGDGGDGSRMAAARADAAPAGGRLAR